MLDRAGGASWPNLRLKVRGFSPPCPVQEHSLD